MTGSVGFNPGVSTNRTTQTGGVVTPGPRAPINPNTGGLPPTSGPVAPDTAPTLPEPQSMDASELMSKFLSLKTKIGNEQLAASVKDVQATGEAKKAQNAEISRKLSEAIDKMKESKGLGILMKVLSWVAVAITAVVAVAAAIATGGALAVAGAALTIAVAVTMASLTEAGVMDKMTEAIAEGLQKEPFNMDEGTAKKWAMGLSMAIQISISLLTMLGGGAIGSAASAAAKGAQAGTQAAVQGTKLATTAAGTAAKAAETGAQAASQTTKLATVAANVASTGKLVGAVTTGVSATTGIVKGSIDYDVAQNQADQAELKKFLAKLQQQQDDEMDRIQTMMQQMTEATSKAMKIISGQTDSTENIIRHMA